MPSPHLQSRLLLENASVFTDDSTFVQSQRLVKTKHMSFVFLFLFQPWMLKHQKIHSNVANMPSPSKDSGRTPREKNTTHQKSTGCAEAPTKLKASSSVSAGKFPTNSCPPGDVQFSLHYGPACDIWSQPSESPAFTCFNKQGCWTILENKTAGWRLCDLNDGMCHTFLPRMTWQCINSGAPCAVHYGSSLSVPIQAWVIAANRHQKFACLRP